MLRQSSYGAAEFRPSLLPPLTDSPPYKAAAAAATSSHVTCFSDQMEDQKCHGDMIIQTYDDSDNNVPFPFPRMSSLQGSFYSNQAPQSFGSFQLGDSVLMQDQSVLSMLLHDPEMKRTPKTDFSQDTDDMAQRSFDDQNDPSSSAGPVDLDCLWNY